MRLAKAIAMAGALAVIAAAPASAAPLIPNPGAEQATNIVQVSGGCGVARIAMGPVRAEPLRL
jgi:hypothetical protein